MHNKWAGDFTLPRLRAKLANKYLLHPDVEPAYAEMYRSDLSQMAIVKKDSPLYQTALRDGPIASMDSNNMSRTWAHGTSQGGRLMATTSLANLSSPSSPVKAHAMTWGGAASAPLPRSAMTLSESSSAPSLGVRRCERPPAATNSLKRLAPDRHHTADQAARSATVQPAQGTAPPPVDKKQEQKAQEKEKQAELASRRLWAAAHGSEFGIKQMIETLKDEDPEASMHVILQRLSKETFPGMQMALRAGAKVDWVNPEWDGATLLLKSVRTDALEVAMYVLSLGADPAITDESQRGVLHWASIEGNAKMVEFFLANTNDVKQAINVPDSGGDCALHLAAYHGHLPVVRLLIRNGADPETTNDGGFTPLELAQATRMWHVAGYLNERGQQEEDRSLKDGVQLRDLLRPCDVDRAQAVKGTLVNLPKPKPKKGAVRRR